MKTNDLIEQRAGIVARMNSAHEADDNTAFEAAETELRGLDAKLERQRKIDAADRTEPGTPLNGNSTPEFRGYSLARRIAHQLDPSIDAGKEIEIEQELARRSEKAAKGIRVPLEYFETRATQTTSNSAGIVAESFRPDLFTSALTASTALQALGATVLTGLTGNVVIPRETGSPAVGWVSEDQALPTGNASFDNVTLSPHHVGAITELSRQLIMQASPAADAILRQMLSRNIALEIDRAAINGSGTGAEPRGLLNDPDVDSVPFTTDLFITTADMIAAADLANVASNRGFLATNGVKATAMKLRTVDGLPIPYSATFHDEPVQFSNQAPSNLGVADDEHALIYGDWRDFLVGIWSQLDILVNPFAETAYSKGNILIRAMATVDFGVRRPASFVKASGVTVA
ncbi:phage major capsid protein [Sphingobium baderi]|uniref:Major capsid protein n=1 Tax=Sphingobium baderi TaxID=1332080 RepID=A0A0S3F381_9SPHN|nr:phage major capsid protein [Sphingobium baderi]ALR22071.1 major capsid protein [Sphingobium baderi]